MATWIIDSGNTKKGYHFSITQDNVSTMNIVEEAGIKKSISKPLTMLVHSASDPRNTKLYIKTLENGTKQLYFGLTKDNSSAGQPIDLDVIKAYLDSSAGQISSLVSMTYIFDDAEAEVTTKDAVENSKLITKQYDAENDIENYIDITNSEVLWSTGTQKSVVNYFYAGKVSGINDTYFIMLNGFRTELFANLESINSHTFDYTISGGDGLKSKLITPIVSNATLVDNDIILAPKNEFTIDMFTMNSLLNVGSVNFSVKTNCERWEQQDNGSFKFVIGDRETAYVSILIPTTPALDLDNKIAIRRTFTVHKG